MITNFTFRKKSSNSIIVKTGGEQNIKCSGLNVSNNKSSMEHIGMDTMEQMKPMIESIEK